MLPEMFNHCLNKIRNGNKQGIVPIYEEYYEKMTLTAVSKVKDLGIAENIASDFISYLLENAGNIGYIESPNAWIYKSILNRAITQVRREVRSVSLEVYEEVAFTKDSDPDLYIAFIDSLNNLKESDRELILLHFVYGYKYKEMSSMLGIPEGTIKRQIFDIRQDLNILKKYF